MCAIHEEVALRRLDVAKHLVDAGVVAEAIAALRAINADAATTVCPVDSRISTCRSVATAITGIEPRFAPVLQQLTSTTCELL